MLRLAIAIGVIALGMGTTSAQVGPPLKPSKAELTIEEQPGHQPSPAEEELGAAYQRQPVFFRTVEPPGTIVVLTSQRYLYVVQGNNRALRYGIGVGREGFQWAGLQKISRKAEWPDWTPPAEMIERQPYSPVSWLEVPAIRSAPARSISAARSTASMGPTSRKRLAMQCRRAASAW
jgi:lipoprotein-anchoring transpeptidase ErfK/SrfK